MSYLFLSLPLSLPLPTQISQEAMARSGRLAEFQLLEEGAQLDDFDSTIPLLRFLQNPSLTLLPRLTYSPEIVVGLDAEEVRFLESQNEMKYEEDLHKRREIQAYMSEVANNVVKAGELSPAEEYFINQQKCSHSLSRSFPSSSLSPFPLSFSVPTNSDLFYLSVSYCLCALFQIACPATKRGCGEEKQREKAPSQDCPFKQERRRIPGKGRGPFRFSSFPLHLV